MKILFVLENLAERCGANVNIAMVLAKQLSKRFEVHALVRYDYISPISEEHQKVFGRVHGFYADQAGRITKFTSHDWSKKTSISKVKRFLKNPKMFIAMINAKYFDFSVTKKKCKNAIEEVCKNHKYDVVIGVTAPFYIIRAVAEVNIDCTKMLLQLDPFTNNYALNPRLNKHRKRIERRTAGNLKTVFAGNYLYEDLIAVVSDVNKNIISTPLPGLIVDNMENNSKQKENSNRNIDFLFVGQFYEKIRNPHYLLELFTYLPSNYVLHIVGGGCNDELDAYAQILGDKLVQHGWVSKEEANNYIAQYDVLVNINNTITNQIPSKLFEYISTGKPILNICKLEKCLSKPYLEKYVNGISIMEKTDLYTDNADAIKKFIDKNKNHVLNNEEILNRFWENTDVYVAGLIGDEIERVCQDK